jgi:hypothetical protein
MKIAHSVWLSLYMRDNEKVQHPSRPQHRFEWYSIRLCFWIKRWLLTFLIVWMFYLKRNLTNVRLCKKDSIKPTLHLSCNFVVINASDGSLCFQIYNLTLDLFWKCLQIIKYKRWLNIAIFMFFLNIVTIKIRFNIIANRVLL